ncbi:11792_t:CDS:1, partial [Gigaspora rosea]
LGNVKHINEIRKYSLKIFFGRHANSSVNVASEFFSHHNDFEELPLAFLCDKKRQNL